MGPMTRLLGTAAALAALCAALWCAWLGWDHEYYLVDGYPQGPYQAWQVIGCAATVTAGTGWAWRRLRTTAATFLLPCAAIVGFAVPWSVDAARTDESGLWIVGLGMLLVGGTAALVVVLAILSAFIPARPRG